MFPVSDANDGHEAISDSAAPLNHDAALSVASVRSQVRSANIILLDLEVGDTDSEIQIIYTYVEGFQRLL